MFVITFWIAFFAMLGGLAFDAGYHGMGWACGGLACYGVLAALLKHFDHRKDKGPGDMRHIP